jgi:hypothetical protein
MRYGLHDGGDHTERARRASTAETIASDPKSPGGTPGFRKGA